MFVCRVLPSCEIGCDARRSADINRLGGNPVLLGDQVTDAATLGLDQPVKQSESQVALAAQPCVKSVDIQSVQVRPEHGSPKRLTKYGRQNRFIVLHLPPIEVLVVVVLFERGQQFVNSVGWMFKIVHPCHLGGARKCADGSFRSLNSALRRGPRLRRPRPAADLRTATRGSLTNRSNGVVPAQPSKIVAQAGAAGQYFPHRGAEKDLRSSVPSMFQGRFGPRLRSMIWVVRRDADRPASRKSEAVLGLPPPPYAGAEERMDAFRATAEQIADLIKVPTDWRRFEFVLGLRDLIAEMDARSRAMLVGAKHADEI